jgi:hypothetical protein
LGEDYHALIRRYHFEFPGSTNIEVRKKVEVNAYPDSGLSGESFVEGYTIPRRNTRQSPSSFDEPLASALTGDLEYAAPQPVLPMLPNGTNRRSFPIRQTVAGIGDGMSEQLGRIRREMHHRSSKAKSPPSQAFLPDNAAVPLEFDEEDEDFMLSRTNSEQPPAPPSPSEPIPATGILNLDEEVDMQQEQSAAMPEEDDMWHRWGAEEHQVVEESEKFDQISVKAFMDEEQKEKEEEQKQEAGKRRRRKGKK